MTVICCFGVAVAAIWISLASLVVSVATSHWITITETDDNLQQSAFLYPFHQGLWMTCYEATIPDYVKLSDLVMETCVLDYDFQTYQVEDYARTSSTCLVIACGVVFTSGLIGTAGCKYQRNTPLLLSGVLMFLSGVITILGACAYIVRMIMEQTNPKILIPSGWAVAFGWSFYLCWASLCTQLLAAMIMVIGVKKCGSSVVKTLENSV